MKQPDILKKKKSFAQITEEAIRPKYFKNIFSFSLTCIHTIMYDTGCKQNRKVEKHGLKTLHSPKQVNDLSEFEKDLIAVVKDIKFRNAGIDFQVTLQEFTTQRKQ